MVDMHIVFGMLIGFPVFPVQAKENEFPETGSVSVSVFRSEKGDERTMSDQARGRQTLRVESERHTVRNRDAFCRL